jgi:hypothetical protein
MKKVIGQFLLIFSLTACATAQKYEAKLNQEIGKTSEQLIASFGNPTQVRKMKNGDMVIIYTYREDDLIPSPDVFDSGDFVTEDEAFYDFTYGGYEIPIGNDVGELVTDYCQTRFYLKNNIVQSWQYKGNACVAL